MIPKKLKHLLPIIALQNKEDLSLLTKLSSFYWDNVRETLSTTDHMRVNLINLGVFVRKTWNVDKMINKVTSTLNALEKTNRVAVIKNLKIDLEHLHRVKEFQRKEQERKEQVKVKRNEYNQDLEKQGSDTRGNNQ